MNNKRLAAIDIGSNSVRLLITDVIDYKGSPFFKKDIFIRIPLKLGEDTFTNGYIGEVKLDKLATLLMSFKGIIDINDVDDWRICATSAIREASNMVEVVNTVFSKTGIEIDVINTIEEARFIIINSIEQNMDDDRAYLFADVGGGSTDLILFYQKKEIAMESFRIGTLRLSDVSEGKEQGEWLRMKNWIYQYCREFTKISLIGSGGNINKIDSLLRRCGRIRREELVSFARTLKGMTIEERVIKYNMNTNRANVILPAISIYLKIMKMARALTVETPIIGVSDGIIKDLYLRKVEAPNTKNTIAQI
jgi:exopolyphosphatase/guanosine-5'-triphosphate,3'-diphosphate pyrophosphatase